MATTTTANKTSRINLLVPTILAVSGGKGISSLTLSGSTVTGSSSAHGWVTNNWLKITGADVPNYNGVFPIIITDSNVFTYTIGTDGSPASLGTVTCVSGQAGIMSSIWASGTGGSVGGLSTALGARLETVVTNGSNPPTAAPTVEVYIGTGQSGIWQLYQTFIGGSTTSFDNQSRNLYMGQEPQAACVFFYNVTGNGCKVAAYGHEFNSLTNA